MFLVDMSSCANQVDALSLFFVVFLGRFAVRVKPFNGSKRRSRRKESVGHSNPSKIQSSRFITYSTVHERACHNAFHRAPT